MRVELEPVDDFLRMLWQNRPCPQCGSPRVTVSKQPREGVGVLIAACADCDFERRQGETRPFPGKRS